MAISLNVSHPIDAKDRQILDLVQRDAKLAQAEIARRVGLSTASVNERLRKLEAASLIRRYVALVDPRGVGVSVTAFVEVFIEHPRFGWFWRGVYSFHHITGEFSLLLKIRVRDMESLQHLLIHRLNALEGVRQTRTVVVLSTSKEECYVPTGATGEPT